MASDPPFSEPGTPGGGRLPIGISPLRAFIVLVVFLVAVATLVDIGTRPPANGEAAPPAATTTTTAAAGSGATTTTTTVPRSSISVQVANATTAPSLAAHYTAVLTPQGWAMKAPLDATTKETTSAVYYAAGQQAAAAAIASSLGLKPTAVLPLTTSVPVTGAAGNDVVVVIGADLVTQAGT